MRALRRGAGNRSRFQRSARAGSLDAFVNEVNAQTGKKITAAQAAMLLQLVQSLY